MTDVVKIGGNVINDPAVLSEFLKIFSGLPGKKVLVHGGGREASALARAMGIEPVMVSGRRVTDRNMLDIVTMVYSGLINKRIVARLQELGCNAIGLSGADANTIPAVKRSPEPIDFGFVGDINPESVNSSFIELLLTNGMTPVFSAICHDANGTLLNCNADGVAASLARAIASEDEVRLTYCFEMPGVLSDVNDPSSVIPLVTLSNFTELKEKGIIAGGMLPKIENALASASSGVAEVRICAWNNMADGCGTILRKE